MEQDDEVKNITGAHYDFGARVYDPRLGRFFSTDPLTKKYPNLTPYHFTSNTPTIFVDYDGNDFGLKIDATKKTIIIVANIYTTSATTYSQALKAAGQWNSKSVIVEGYTVSFQVKVVTPKPTYGGAKSTKLVRDSRAWSDATRDNIGNEYAGLDGWKSVKVSGKNFDAAVTVNGKHISSHQHNKSGDLGNNPGVIAHEFGHLFGLDDEIDKKTGKQSEYYGGHSGIMKYGSSTNPISDLDVKTILRYANDVLTGKLKDPNGTNPDVTIINNVKIPDISAFKF